MRGIKIMTPMITTCIAADMATVQDLFVLVEIALDTTSWSNMMLSPCGCRRALIGCGSGAHGCSLSTMILIPKHHDRCCDTKTGVRSYHNSYHHGKRECAKHLAAHREQDQHGKEG